MLQLGDEVYSIICKKGMLPKIFKGKITNHCSRCWYYGDVSYIIQHNIMYNTYKICNSGYFTYARFGIYIYSLGYTLRCPCELMSKDKNKLYKKYKSALYLYRNYYNWDINFSRCIIKEFFK